jgi:CheY-like chemotaxis protein
MPKQPAVLLEALDTDSAMRQPVSMTESARVLIVDDEADFRAAMSMLLSLDGFQVSEAIDGSAAVRLVTASPPAERPHVVLLDFRMPGMNGGEVLRRLREAGIEAGVILVSAIADIRSVAARHGFDGAIPKPCDHDELLAAIHRCASRARSAS